MERFSFIYNDYYHPVDNQRVLEQISGTSYEEDFIFLEKKDFLYYIFDNVNQSLVGYVLAGHYKNFQFFKEKADCIGICKLEVFKENFTKKVNYQNKGFGGILLDLITKHAQSQNIPFICLFATDLSYKYYFHKNFISLYDKNVMVQIVDSNIKLYASILRESLNRALLNNSFLEDELFKIIKNKDYDNILEYELLKEKKYLNESAYKNFCHIDKLITNKILKNKNIPLIIKALQDKMDQCNYKKEEIYDSFNFKNKLNNNDKLELIYNSMYLLEIDHLVNKDIHNKNNCFIIS